HLHRRRPRPCAVAARIPAGVGLARRERRARPADRRRPRAGGAAGPGSVVPRHHQPPLRTSTIASADWSGPLGSERGPQPFRPGLRVREEQPRFVGWLVDGGYVEIRCRMSLTHRSMAALWLAGWDEDPHDSGELCVVEVFGSAVEPGRSAEVGMGIKALRDPRLRDDVTLRTGPRPPRYPLVLMIGVFDFPDGTETTHTPALEISRVAGTATREGQ